MTEPLVLLPGMMCDARVFEPQVTMLSRERAVMVAPITQGDRIEAIASALLDQLPERFALAGLSMGGIVAMEILRRVPERVIRIGLLDTSPLAETPANAAEYEPLIIATRAGRLEEMLGEILRPEYLAPGVQRSAVLSVMRDMGMVLGPDVFETQARALQRRQDQQKTLRQCRVPALVLCGEHDSLTPVKRHHFMAELIPNAELSVIEDAGHIPTLEQPEATTEALRNWLARPAVVEMF